MAKIPSIITKYLWDVDNQTLDLSVHKNFIIERVLEYGDLEAFRWLSRTYAREKILEVLIASKRLSPKTGNLFALYFNLPKEKLLCIRKPFIQKQNRF